MRFREFTASTDTDMLAGKGVGYVRVRWEQPVNLFFTHLQASYPRDGRRHRRGKVAVRRRQLRQMATLIRDALPGPRRVTEPALLLGDLNVEGRRDRHHQSQSGERRIEEWAGMMGILGRVLPDLEDVWEQRQDNSDLGLTFPAATPRSRYDYVLFSPGREASRLRVSRIALAEHLSSPSLSDHFGVEAHFHT